MEFTEKHGPRIDSLQLDYLMQQQIKADVLRLDLIHPLISGNKWYKLKEYIKEAKTLQKKVVITFGGPYSNHILATAAACSIFKIPAIGLIRGEEPKTYSPTLMDAQHQNMRLMFLPRKDYQDKLIPDAVFDQYSKQEVYVINEGGYGQLGMKGAASILNECTGSFYTHILCAVGTGTTLAGLRYHAQQHQQIIGVSALKNNFSLTQEVERLLEPMKESFSILHDFHFGGYAKYNPGLLEFMNEWFRQTGIPSDFVYTAKLFYAFAHLCQNGYFSRGSNILLIHSGGLQGNRSLPQGTLIF